MVIAIDLGSNTFRVALVKKEQNGFSNEQIYEKIVGAARGLNESGKIADESKNRLFEAIAEAKSKFDFDKFKCVAVATEAFRVASNSEEIFSEIREKFGINFHIISGKAEAKLTFLGVQNAFKKLGINENFSVIDIGGASSEIGEDGNFMSFKFGIITFFEKFKTLDLMQENAKFYTKDAREFLNSLKNRFIVLTSGVPTTIVALRLGLNYENYDPKKVSGYELRDDDLAWFIGELLKMDDKSADLAVGRNRKYPLIAGTLLLEELLSGQEAKFLVIDDGLREGVGVAYLQGKFQEIITNF
ncbi:disulfide bond formation protein DsbA [Campylobacter concisus]|uniref:Disulfide bond formation protein DsbA n=1 Tax=Campylobacter concisus TaxID=199 RepID=A0A7S9NF31_9BACT|nr:disulfide bond formation protein DsbA [Campylobacter concisus]QPH84501.1 disulfide bond formation protein DsbA [Campylobacter concisus]